MASFWKNKSDKPLVWNYNGWYYCIEYYGITYTFIDIEKLREYRNDIANRKRRWVRSSQPILSKTWFALQRHNLRERYIHFRHREEIVNLFDRAYEQFSIEQDKDEVANQTENSSDWR
jgi:hypothetical protein